MPNVNGFAKHQRASTHDAFDVQVMALAHGFIGYATQAERAVEPYARNTAFAALAHDVARNRRMSRDHHAIYGRRERGNIRETWVALRF